jgi:hypothetical protein
MTNINSTASLYCWFLRNRLGSEKNPPTTHRVRAMVFNATFNNISVISWQSVLLVEITGEDHQSVRSN